MDATDDPQLNAQDQPVEDGVDAPPPMTPQVPARMSGEEMVDLLSTMARQLAGDAPPVLRDLSAVAAEVAASAARATGPAARVAADATDDLSIRVAERLEEYAAEVREQQALESARSTEIMAAPDRAIEPEGERDADIP